MTDPLNSTAPGDAPATAAAPGSRSDLQRAALRDLVGLSAECATIEAQIEERYRSALETCRAEHEKALEDIERRYREIKADIEHRHEDYLARIHAQFEADLKTLNESEAAARERLDHDFAGVEQEVKKKYTQEAWLAESVFEGVRNQLREDANTAQKEFTARIQSLDLLEQRAAALMQSYGHSWPGFDAADAEPSDPAGVSTAFDSRQAAAEEHLAILESLRAPRLVAGVLPFFVSLLLCAIAAGIGQLASGSRTPHWQAMGLAVGITLGAVLIALALLRRLARRQVNAAAVPLRRTLSAARRAAQAEFDEAARLRKEKHAEALRKRDAEVREAKTRFAPILNEASEKREALLKALQEERDRLLPRIEAQRELGLRETKEWHERSLAELEQGRNRELEAARKHHESQLDRIQHRYEQGCRALEHRWNEGLARIQKPVEEGSRADVGMSYRWDDPVWQTWVPPSRFASVIRFGELRVDLEQITDKVPRRLALPETFTVPALLAFPRQASLLIHTDHAGRAEALRAIQAVMVRLLTSLPAGRVRFTIIDPVGLGQNFAGFMHLADHDEALVGSRIWTEPEHIEQRLADLTEHMETVIQKYLRNEFQTIDDYNAQAGELAEPYRFLVIADFPANLTDVAIQRLNSIAGTGARCGVYTLIVHDTRRALPAGTHVDELEAHSINLAREGMRFVWQDDVFRAFPLTLEAPPGEEFLTRILHVVGRYAKESRRVEVPFESIAPPDARMWSADSSLDIEVPIGRMGATRLQMLRLGRGVMQHALIAGKTGSGKSTLLHVLVTNLALWYSPDEVEFYLVDFKKGVEFKTYATNALPHARAIAVESDREFGLSVLQRVDAELTRRGNLFRRQGVQDLASYRQASGEKLPRTLLIIDEFQEFFSEDDRLAQDAGLLLDRLVRQGRAFGIHVLLGSQTIGGTSGLARSTIGQMAVRIALQTSEADSQIILGDGNSAARLLSRPGEAIYNDAGGLVEGNSPFQVAWLPDEQRDAYLARIERRAGGRAHNREAPVVFEGNVPADITKNALLASLLDAPDWPPAAAATRAWLGEPVAIKEATHILFRRQSGANMLLVGQQDDAALAIMAAVIVSFAAQHRPDAASFHVFDGSPADSPLATVFARVTAALPHATRRVEYRAVGEAMSELAEERKRRQASPDAPLPAIYVLVYGLQRYRLLRRQEDTFSFSAGAEEAGPGPDRIFADLLREGPPLGIHVIAWADTLATVERTFDRGSVREFDNRILFQMSAADSSNLIDSPLANKLGPNRALAYSEEQGTTEKFRPYALPNEAWLERVRTRLARRAQNGPP
jgi:hypothetical protein